MIGEMRYQENIDGGIIAFSPSFCWQRGESWRDYSLSRKWFLKAAARGNGRAAYAIGTIHEMGRGVPQNYAEATKWHRAAAELGYPYATSALGSLYMKMQDNISAHMWFNVAGASIRDQLARLMTPDQIATAQKLATEWVDQHNQSPHYQHTCEEW